MALFSTVKKVAFGAGKQFGYRGGCGAYSTPQDCSLWRGGGGLAALFPNNPTADWSMP